MRACVNPGVAEHDHDFGEWETVTEATCEVDGEAIRYCTTEGCDESETKVLPALGHLMSEWESGHGPGPDEDYPGEWEMRYCTRGCDDYMEERQISEEHNHTFGEWETVTEATCVDAGEAIRYCTVDGCDESETKTLPALGHLMSAWESGHGPGPDEDYPGEWEIRYCTRGCDDYMEERQISDEHTHAFGDWQTVTEATCVDAGEAIRYCTTAGCTGSETKVLPALGHLMSEWESGHGPGPDEDYPGEWEMRYCTRGCDDYMEERQISPISTRSTFAWTNTSDFVLPLFTPPHLPSCRLTLRRPPWTKLPHYAIVILSSTPSQDFSEGPKYETKQSKTYSIL